MITGSTGLDDYEWGVTLFAEHPDDLKEVVYTMRFDRASAIYAEFGPFYTGMVAPVDRGARPGSGCSPSPEPASSGGDRRAGRFARPPRGLDPVVVAFSGGADSALLAWVAHDTLGARPGRWR